MDENLHNIDDLFKKALDEHKETPAQDVWENIDKNLDKKKVIFISKKYNKLKWVAAALLMFSAGMAMYTWHTKMKNKELAEQNFDINRKQSERGKLEKDNNTNIDKTDKARTAKDTLSTSDPNKANPPSAAVNEAFSQNKNKGLTGDKKANPTIPAEKPLINLSENVEKDNKKIKGTTEGQLAVQAGTLEEKENVGKIGKPGSLNRDEKNISTNNLDITKERPYKEITAETELQKRDINIETANVSLQRVLATLKDNNQIISEKPGYEVKSLKAKKPDKNLFSATVFYSPDFISSKVDNDHHRFREDDRDEIKKRERIENSYTAGLLIDVNTGKKFSIESGLTFSSMTTYIDPKQIYARPDNDGNVNYRFNCSAGYSYIPAKPGSGVVAGDSIPALSSKNILQYLGVPVVVKYNLSKGKFSLHPGVGIAVNFLTKGKIETVIGGAGGNEKANINHIEGLSKTYFNALMNLGAEYNLNKNISLNFTPAARLALTSINKGAPVKTFLNSTGLAAGLTIRL